MKYGNFSILGLGGARKCEPYYDMKMTTYKAALKQREQTIRKGEK